MTRRSLFSAPNLAVHIGSRGWWAQLVLLCTLVIALVTAGLLRTTHAEAAADADTLPEPLVLPIPVTPLVLLPEMPVENPDQPIHHIHDFRLKRGGTLMDAMLDAGVGRTDAHYAIASLRGLTDVRKLQPGVAGRVVMDEDVLVSLALRLAPDRELIAKKADTRYETQWHALDSLTMTAHAQGPISRSLYLDARAAGVPVDVLAEMIRLFSYDVDFQRDVWAGDRFSILYERHLVATDGAVSNGAILKATLQLQGRTLSLTRFLDPETGDMDYYHDDGRSVRRSLLKTPIDGARLTSRFGRRKHPVLGYTRMHKGLDFGAAPGTPIYAAGDGSVERASRHGSYGHYVRLRHGGGYQTAYAHLSRYGPGIKAGKKVRQGDIIGYVGATGRVTGPHLHYEVLRDGHHVNPQRLKLPPNKQLTGSVLESFSARHKRLQDDIKTLGAIDAQHLAAREES